MCICIFCVHLQPFIDSRNIISLTATVCSLSLFTPPYCPLSMTMQQAVPLQQAFASLPRLHLADAALAQLTGPELVFAL